jgi:hypothetical protein
MGVSSLCCLSIALSVCTTSSVLFMTIKVLWLFQKIKFSARCWWLMPVILANWEAEIVRITV